MSQDGSVAPKERVNIKYIATAGEQQSEVELPLKTVVIGDFKGHSEDTPIEDRDAVSVDKNNFESVLQASGLKIETRVENRLSEEENPQELDISLSIQSLSDFSPDAIGRQVPELKKLIKLREALLSLKGPLGNVPAFRSRLQTLLASDQSREQLLNELQLLDPEAAVESE
ncbi:type VI secretion system contractile sheath small subunit [Pelagibaculum spongiae]|uniref:Type VI secretion system contractile sheath small subunit n=1 Tax=Pelagibaculum spongiae TaxID=2080658 RepID=A0A2V1GZH3_9GAMM|nr:type VI secretion system contractile sheath small subunit [Pelagibaculum spongiae]PVZ68772.1 type VI secretion system contractile sheath small subunit [Pelagibaculum spongiae]